MPLPSSGQVSLSDIAAEFGGVVPHSMSEYLGAAAGVPASGRLRIRDFYGKADNKLASLFKPGDFGDWWATGYSPASAAGTGLNGNLVWNANAEQTSGTAPYIVGYGSLNNGGTQSYLDVRKWSTDSGIHHTGIITLIECRVLKYSGYGFYGKAQYMLGVHANNVTNALFIKLEDGRGQWGKLQTSSGFGNYYTNGQPVSGYSSDNKTVFRMLTVDPTKSSTPVVSAYYQVNGGAVGTNCVEVASPSYNVGGNWSFTSFNTTYNSHKTTITALAVIDRVVTPEEFGAVCDWIYNDSTININTGNRS